MNKKHGNKEEKYEDPAYIQGDRVEHYDGTETEVNPTIPSTRNPSEETNDSDKK